MNDTDKLNQRRFFDKRQFSLGEDSVKIEFRDLRRITEMEIGYDTITGTRNRSISGSVSSYVIMRLAFVCAGLSVIAVQITDSINYYHTAIFAGVGVIFLVAYYLSRYDFIQIGLNNDTHIFMHNKEPDEETVNTFYNELISKRNAYMKDKYLNFDPLISYEVQMQNLNRLHDFKVLEKDEFEEQEHKLKKIFGNVENERPQIGFRK